MLNILDALPLAHIVPQPPRPIINRLAEVQASIAVRGEQKAVGDSRLINHGRLPLQCKPPAATFSVAVALLVAMRRIHESTSLRFQYFRP